jgi:hypothetical protein
MYDKLIHEIAQRLDPNLNPVGVEASMRLQYGTLSHLDHAVFVDEAKLAQEMEREKPGCLRSIAISFGMGRDFDEWESGSCHCDECKAAG